MDSIELSQAAREARRRYSRAWNAANKDKRAAINRRYWERRAERDAAAKAAAEQEADDGTGT